MQATASSLPVIDVDAHISEPADLWTSRAPHRLASRVPRIVRSDTGSDQWLVDGRESFGPPGFCVIRRDASKAYGILCLDRFEELHAGASQVAPRLALMDEQGLAAQIVYPNVLGFAGNAIMRVADLELRSFCVTAYNDAMAQLQAEGQRRLYPQFVLPIWDIEASVRELVRCHDQLGLSGFVISDAPETWGLPTLSETSWDPLWAAAQERGLPVNFHIGGGGLGGVSLWRGPALGQPSVIAATSAQLFLGNARAIANLIFSGLLDRFPSLNFVSVESGVGWLPFYLDVCEYQFDENGVTSLKLRPKQYFRRQIYAAYWFERDLRHAVERLGEDNLLFETDFPHPTCVYPGVREHVQASMEGLPERAQRKILYQNAQHLYGITLQ